jgi:hypothetical protein
MPKVLRKLKKGFFFIININIFIFIFNPIFNLWNHVKSWAQISIYNVENSKVGWRAHMHIGDLSSEEVNFVKVDREILPWILSWTRVFM